MKILVGYDGSPLAEKCLDLAVRHARGFAGEVFIATSMLGGAEVPRLEFEKAEELLKRAARVVTEAKIPCTTRLLVRGLTPGEDLALFIEENGIDEVIIGVKRKSKVGKLLFGSTAQYIILRAKCSVVTVK